MTAPTRPGERRPATLDLPDLIGPDDQINADAVAALERAADQSVVALVAPPPSTPAAATSAAATSARVGGGVVVGGIGAAVLALDKVLRDHGETLETLTAAGPLTGALLQNWPIVLGLFLLARMAAARWSEHQAKQRARDALAGKAAQAQIRLLRRVGVDLEGVVAELAGLRQDVGAVRTLAGETAKAAREDDEKLGRRLEEVAAELRNRIAGLEARPR